LLNALHEESARAHRVNDRIGVPEAVCKFVPSTTVS